MRRAAAVIAGEVAGCLQKGSASGAQRVFPCLQRAALEGVPSGNLRRWAGGAGEGLGYRASASDAAGQCRAVDGPISPRCAAGSVRPVVAGSLVRRLEDARFRSPRLERRHPNSLGLEAHSAEALPATKVGEAQHRLAAARDVDVAGTDSRMAPPPKPLRGGAHSVDRAPCGVRGRRL